MAKIKNIQCLRSAVLACATVLASVPSWAARDFTPQAGTWVVSQELNGKPGRGLAIDVQGNTFFMQVFAYEQNGEATFYAATGQMDGYQVTAPLMRYWGGRSFGSAARDAIEDKSLGDVHIRFRNGLAGTVQFPGEPELAIERFLVRSDTPGVTNPRAQTGVRALRMLVLDGQGDVAYHWNAELTRVQGDKFQLSLQQPRVLQGSHSLETFQQIECQLQSQRTQWSCGSAFTKSTAAEPAAGPLVEALSFELVGFDLMGKVQLQGAPAGAQSPITGYDLGAQDVRAVNIDGVITRTTFGQQNYHRVDEPERQCAAQCTESVYIYSLMPLNGTWVIDDELTGKPGRGLALDIQGDTAILQVYNYRPSLQPSFHMGSAAFRGSDFNSLSSTTTLPLDEYAGGRSVGGSQRSAQWRRQAGEAKVDFFYQPPYAQTPESERWWTWGQLELPGEDPHRIQRLQLERPDSAAQALLGKWYLHDAHKTLHLTRMEGDRATTEDGSVVCEMLNNLYVAEVACGQPGKFGRWEWRQVLQMPVMNRGGTMTRLLDRHGNAVGLGVLD